MRQPAVAPTDSEAIHGKLVFERGACAMCHAVTGTVAGATLGPDLTHVASRRSLAAGTLTNTRGNLAGWIVDPQRLKPGAQMPTNELDGTDLRALVAYLETLR